MKLKVINSCMYSTPTGSSRALGFVIECSKYLFCLGLSVVAAPGVIGNVGELGPDESAGCAESYNAHNADEMLLRPILTSGVAKLDLSYR